MTSGLHEERLQAVLAAVRRTGARRLLDLGCGDGDLLVRLAQAPGLDEIVGLDLCAASIERARRRLAELGPVAPRIDLRAASLIDPAPDLAGFDCALLVETIEHIDPGRLSQVERAVFHRLRPGLVIVTTPNAEFNSLLGVPPHRFRHPDHRFEWPRAKFRSWCARVAGASRYAVTVEDIAGRHPDLGGATQMAVFQRTAETA
ncbi:MAG: methyltransferase domain-containing protein [Pseudomonadota bacterium]